METLKSKLEEANGDILALRNQMQKGQSLEELNGNRKIYLNSKVDFEQMVHELEKIQKKVCLTLNICFIKLLVLESNVFLASLCIAHVAEYESRSLVQ